MLARGGWGLNLGFSDTFNENTNLYTIVGGRDSVSFDTTVNESKVSRTAIRLGVGWQTTIGTARILEIGVGGSYVDREVTSREVESDETQFDEFSGAWTSDPGLGFDLTIRTVSTESGLLVGGHFAYEELNPKTDELELDLVSNRHAAHFQVGWRFEEPPIDDLVLGAKSFWRESLGVSVDSRGDVIENEESDYSAGVFVSGEHDILEGLTVRGGFEGTATFNKTRRFSTDRFGTIHVTRENGRNRGSFNSARFFLGGGWKWKSLVLDFQIRESLNLDYPVVRWSATLEL